MPQILCDLDGVLLDFITPAMQLHNADPSIVTSWDIHSILGITHEQFWKPINRGGQRFWTDLPEYPWCDELVGLIEKIDPDWHVSTSPSRSHNSAAGKVKWLQKKFGPKFRRYMLGESKHLFANQDSVLIDDNEQTIQRFNECGGFGVLFPAKWNSLHRLKDPIRYVKKQLQGS